MNMRLPQRALRDVHGRLDELTTVATERLTTAAQAGHLQMPAVRTLLTSDNALHAIPTANQLTCTITKNVSAESASVSPPEIRPTTC
ncbi:hypothetical protein ACIA8E_38055 [Streptomyces sp. NPDC051664]|uniref:hypothetical protein n=1 Tax=Streptomyces sp. NPDC051664 TaxID=3365668 RepID=UPI0037AED01A